MAIVDWAGDDHAGLYWRVFYALKFEAFGRIDCDTLRRYHARGVSVYWTSIDAELARRARLESEG